MCARCARQCRRRREFACYFLPQSITSRSVSTRSSRASRAVAGTTAACWALIGEPIAITGLISAQAVDGQVVVAGAVADAVALAVEAASGTSRISGQTSGASASARGCPRRRTSSGWPNAQARMISGLPRADHDRQRQRGAGVGELAHQRHRIEFALHRRIGRDHHAGRDLIRERPRGDRLGRRGPRVGRQGVALGQIGLAEFRLEFFERESFAIDRSISRPESAEPHWPSER